MREDYPWDAPATNAQILLPEGFELIEGNLEWKGDVIRGTPVEMKVNVRAAKEGDWKIEARAGYSPGEGGYYVGSDTLYISVSEDSATVSDRPPSKPWETHPSKDEPYPTPTPSPTNTGENTPAAPFTINVSFPDGAPPLNQEAKLICVVNAKAIRLKDLSVDIKLPEALELVSGELSWNGDVSEGNRIEVIEVTVKSIRTGNWTIELRGYIDPKEHGYVSIVPGWFPAIYVSVYEDSAEWDITPPWYKGNGFDVPVHKVDSPSTPVK